MSAPITHEQIIALVKCNVEDHFLGYRFIKMKDGVVRQPKKLKALQRKLFAAYLWLQWKGLPISIIILKPRQSGGSEGTAEVVYHHSRRFNLSGFMMADKDDHTTNIWNLFTACAQTDIFGDMWGNKFKSDAEKAHIAYKDGDGKLCTAIWNRGTANSITAGASGTRQIVWFSESARYAREGAFRDTDVIGNVLNSVPGELPNTLRIAESTAEGGAGGWHHDTFNAGSTLEEAQAGKFGNGWISIFVAWHEEEDYSLEEKANDAEFFNDHDDRWTAFREDEEAGRMRYSWTREQVAWRRKKIVRDLGGDVQLFRRDYPSSPEEAWSASGNKRFNVVAVAHMLLAAKESWKQMLNKAPTAPKLGSLQNGATGPVFIATREDAWLWVAEPPMPGCSYSLTCDPMIGEQSKGSMKRDAHAPLVIRAAYVDRHGAMVNAAVVAAIHQPGEGCQWENDILAKKMEILSTWYGRCIIVLEANVALDVIAYLKPSGIPMYYRPVRPDMVNPSVHQKTIGFQTNNATRDLWVSAAAEAIREGTVDCLYLPAVQQFDVFIKNKDGKCEAAAGMHDDWVAAFGIGILTINAATKMPLPYGPHGHGGYTSGGRAGSIQTRGTGAFG